MWPKIEKSPVNVKIGDAAVTFLEDEWGFRGEELRALPQFHSIARRKAGAEERGVIAP